MNTRTALPDGSWPVVAYPVPLVAGRSSGALRRSDLVGVKEGHGHTTNSYPAQVGSPVACAVDAGSPQPAAAAIWPLQGSGGTPFMVTA